MDRFGIVFDKPNFCPGQPVTGKVVFQVGKAIKARSLKVSIHGAAETKWKENETRMRNNDGKQEPYTETVHYFAEVQFVSNEKIIWVPKIDEVKLVPGKHFFPFSFALPSQCPPSFEGHYGHIRYRVKAELDRPWNFNSEDTRVVTVIPAPENSQVSSTPITRKDVKDIGTVFKKGVVTMKVNIPKHTYSIGESIPITIDIDNTSTRAATSVCAGLHQHSHYHANRDSFFSSQSSHPKYSKNKTKLVAEISKDIRVGGGTKSRQELSLKVPKLSPTFRSSIIQVDYCLSVKSKTETSLNNTLHCEFPLIITPPGSLPSAPPQRLDSVPPAYSLGLSAPNEQSSSTNLPPSYEEAMSVTKI